MKWWVALAALLGAVAAAWSQAPALLQAYAGMFVVDTVREPADALVVLAGDPETRVWHAVQLYRAGYAPAIVLTETRASNPAVARLIPGERQQALAILRSAIPDAPVVFAPSLRGGATSTYDEAHDLSRLCRQRGWRHIIIVTDGHHTRRARYAFRKVLRSAGVRVDAAAAPNAVFDETNWWRTDRGLNAYVSEPFKCAAYLLTDRNIAAIENY